MIGPAPRLSRRAMGAGLAAAASLRARPADAAQGPMVIASEDDVTTLDPHLIRNNHPIGSVVWSIFDSLVRRRPDGSHEPRLATRWEQVADDRWLFTLRPGVAFHNGEELDATGVCENLERMRRAPFDGECQLWQQASLTAVAAPDPMTVAIATRGVSVSLLYWLEEAFIGAPRYLRETPPARVGANPVGSGPYRFVRWRPGEHVALTAFDRYWAGAPAIRDVVFKAVPEPSSRLAELRAGEVDLVPDLNPDAAAQANSSVSALAQVAGLRKMHLGLSQRGIAPLRDRRVRAALNHATDVATIIETLQRGMARPLGSVLNPPNASAMPPFTYDPARAQALLREAGATDFSVEVAYDEKYPDAHAICEAVAAYLSDAGPRPQIVAYESGRFAETLRARAFPGLYFYGFGALINPVVELVIFTTDAVDNAGGYSNPAVDALVRRAAATLDEDTRRGLVASAERLVWDDAPWLYLYTLPELYGRASRLRYDPRPDDYVEPYKAAFAS